MKWFAALGSLLSMCGAVCSSVLTSAPAAAAPLFSLRIDDRSGALIGSRPLLEFNLLTAAALWGRHIRSDANIEILFRVDDGANAGRGSGKSLTTVKVGEHSGATLYAQGAAYELQTGLDPNGPAPDIEVVLHPKYLPTLWFDPQPGVRAAGIPANKLDAVTVFLHELGHALAFNGWLQSNTGVRVGDDLSTYDRHVMLIDSIPYFNGPAAVRVNGAPVRLSQTNNNYHHVGELGAQSAAHLNHDLMNGIAFRRGQRYFISKLDLAILEDAGLPVN